MFDADKPVYLVIPVTNVLSILFVEIVQSAIFALIVSNVKPLAEGFVMIDVLAASPDADA